MAKGIRKGVIAPKHFILIFSCFVLGACGIQKAQKTLLQSDALKGAHVGIAVYNDTKQTWLDQYQSDHYFTPASNTKILATYVGLKFLGDSLPGFSMAEHKDTLFLTPLGDPSFLHPDFKFQPVIDLIKNTTKQVVFNPTNANDDFGHLGNGWAWNDYGEDYQPERSRMPIYGNVVHFYQGNGKLSIKPFTFFKDITDISSIYQKNWTRKLVGNQFYTDGQKNTSSYFQVPFDMYFEPSLPVHLLQDTLKIKLNLGSDYTLKQQQILKTVPTDSLLKIMMSRSDNFFAEQVLLMGSQQLLGKIDDVAFIDTLLKTDFSQLPQKMRWADGSGLSRYNLNTPENYVSILKKMQDQFGQSRVTNIFETGGEGTLSAYYKNFPGELHAKTGSLGNQIALSGFVFTLKKQKIYFSILVSNHMSPTSAAVRKAVESYLKTVMRKL